MKRKIITLIICGILILATMLAAIFIPDKLSEGQKEYAPVAIEVIKEPETYEDAYGSLSDDLIDSYFIAVTNKAGLLKDRDEYMNDYAVAALEEYLTRYITYYVDDLQPGQIYEAEYYDRSYNVASNFPNFILWFKYNDKKIMIDCTFNPSIQRYHFDSELDKGDK